MSIIATRDKYPLPSAVWNVYWNLVTVVFAFVPLMVCHLLQYPSLVLLPFSKKAFWAYNRVIAFMIWGWWAYALQVLVGVRIDFTGDEVPQAENAIVIANHQSMSDIPALLCLALEKKRIGDLKWLVKDQLKYVPGIGLGLKFLDALFLKRRWADDQQSVQNTFERYVRMKTPLWLLLFPEGTRSSPKKREVFRSKHPHVETQFVLPPRAKGFVASVQGLSSVIHEVYDITIIYPQTEPPSLIELMRGEVRFIQIHVKRYPISSLPMDDAGLTQWLNQRFIEKDQTIKTFRALTDMPDGR